MSSIHLRCDGSMVIGMGHVTRCLSLAQALREAGVDVSFSMRQLGGGAVKKVRELGFETVTISGPESPDGALSEGDRLQTAETARAHATGWILLDHYGAREDYFEGLFREGFRIAVLDDMADRTLTTCRWLLNQNLGAENLPYRTTGECIRLLGPEYALLRPEFHVARQQLLRVFSGQDRHVILTLGGGQTAQLSLEVIKALDSVAQPLKIRCILGGTQPVSPDLLAAAKATRHEVSILQNVADMTSHMLWADLSVNAGGSTCWELCCLGVPMVTLVTSQDQAIIARALDDYGCARNLGEWQPDRTAAWLAESVRELLANPGGRLEMSRRARSRVDGLGAKRAAHSLLDLIQNEGRT